MKKLFLLVSTLLLGLVLVSCTSTEETVGKDFKVDVFIYEYSDTYIGSVRAELDKQLKGLSNFEVQFYDAGSSQDVQGTQIDGAITAGSDLLVVNIVEPESAETIIDKVKDSELPVLFFNREVSNDALELYDLTAFIGTDPDEAGYMQGELAAEILLANYEELDRNGDGTIGYAMMRADTDNPEANGRTKYSVLEANRLLKAAGKPEMVQVGVDMMASWDTAKAKGLFSSLITDKDQLDKIDIVFTNNDDMALGVIEALKEADFNGKNQVNIPVLGVDATETAVDSIAQGEMAGSIKQDGIAMASAIKIFILEKLANQDFNGFDMYEYEAGSKKVRIPYAKYTGE